MVSKFDDLDISYTVRTEQRSGLLNALDTLGPDTFEVIVHPVGDVNKFTLRTESIEGTIHAVNDLTPEWSHAIVRVFEEAA